MTAITAGNILTEKQICERFNVTPEEIDRATRCIDMATNQVFYIVSSRSGGDDHKVCYDAQEKCLTCACKAGQNGRGCWARRAAMASARLDYQEALIARAKAFAEEKAKREAELEAQREAARVAVAGMKAGRYVHQARPFSLLAY